MESVPSSPEKMTESLLIAVPDTIDLALLDILFTADLTSLADAAAAVKSRAVNATETDVMSIKNESMTLKVRFAVFIFKFPPF